MLSCHYKRVRCMEIYLNLQLQFSGTSFDVQTDHTFDVLCRLAKREVVPSLVYTLYRQIILHY